MMLNRPIREIFVIDLTENSKQLEQAVKNAKEDNITLPTFEQVKNPSLIPDKIKEELKGLRLWEFHSRNLFRITWKNEDIVTGGQFWDLPIYLELPSELTGVKARILILLGKFFPIGAHKVVAAYGCLVPRLVTGQFGPYKHQAVWPSTFRI